MTYIIDNILSNPYKNIEDAIAMGAALEKEVQTLDLNWFQMNIPDKFLKKQNDGVIVTFVDSSNRLRAFQKTEFHTSGIFFSRKNSRSISRR